jgi:hypothetical protein
VITSQKAVPVLPATTGLIVVVTSAIGGFGGSTSRSATLFLAVAGTGLLLWGLDRTIPNRALEVRQATATDRVRSAPMD